MKRLSTDAAVFTGPEDIVVLVHVDDLVVSGPIKLVEQVLKRRGGKVKLKVTAKLIKAGDQGQLLGRLLQRTEQGYRRCSGKKLSDSFNIS